MSKTYTQRSFGLLFKEGDLELLINSIMVSYFIEGTIYKESSEPGLNASGRVFIRNQNGPEQCYEYETLTELIQKIGLNQNGAEKLVKRITALLA